MMMMTGMMKITSIPHRLTRYCAMSPSERENFDKRMNDTTTTTTTHYKRATEDKKKTGIALLGTYYLYYLTTIAIVPAP